MQVHDTVVKCHVISVWLSLLTRGKWKDEADEIKFREQYIEALSGGAGI